MFLQDRVDDLLQSMIVTHWIGIDWALIAVCQLETRLRAEKDNELKIFEF